MKKIPSLLLLCLLSFTSYAQDSSSIEAPKNVIHGSIGTLLFVNSAQLTYDRLLKQSNNGFFKSYYLTLKAGGHAAIDFSGSNGGTGYVTSFGATALTGNGKNHFEIGLGLGYFIDTENIVSPSNPFGTSDESTFYPNVSIGYRKQTSKGFMFRTGFGVVEWAYIGLGFSF
ncbi:MAG: hypothetical protein AB8B59_01845 [Maribacter sp.]